MNKLDAFEQKCDLEFKYLREQVEDLRKVVEERIKINKVPAYTIKELSIEDGGIWFLDSGAICKLPLINNRKLKVYFHFISIGRGPTATVLTKDYKHNINNYESISLFSNYGIWSMV